MRFSGPAGSLYLNGAAHQPSLPRSRHGPCRGSGGLFGRTSKLVTPGKTIFYWSQTAAGPLEISIAHQNTAQKSRSFDCA
jgi:hypothetical protein